MSNSTPVQLPWTWLTSEDLMHLAHQAYRAASWQVSADLVDPVATEQEIRQFFAENLCDMFTDLLMAAASTHGGCWPQSQAPAVAASLMSEVPAHWQPLKSIEGAHHG